jgi:hypothetical protein
MLARKSQLLGPREAALLLGAGDPASALATLGADPFDKLLRLYELALRTYRAPIFRAMLGMHEIENVKLLWRVAANDRDRRAIRRLWRPLGALATVRMPPEVASLRGLVEHLETTPYGAIAKSVLRSGAGEAAFDRWATRRLLDEANRLPRSEALTRQMIESYCGVRRPCRRSDSGGMAAALQNPFLLAPAVAVVLLAEAEVRAVRAIVERGGDASLDDVAMRVVARSRMGG